MIKGSNMTERNSDYLAALRSWRNEKRDFADCRPSIETLKFREAMQRQRDGSHTPENSDDNTDDVLGALQQLVDPDYVNGTGDINSLSALALRGAGNTNASPRSSTRGRGTRHMVTITGAADSLSKAGLGSYKQENNSPMMDVSTGGSTRKSTHAVESMLVRLQRQQDTQARYKQVIQGYHVEGTPRADDTVLSYPSHDKTVRKMLMDTEVTKSVYKVIDKRFVKGVLR